VQAQIPDVQSLSWSHSEPSGCGPHWCTAISQAPNAQSWSRVQEDPFGTGPQAWPTQTPEAQSASAMQPHTPFAQTMDLQS
jgi:hypothetical protein